MDEYMNVLERSTLFRGMDRNEINHLLMCLNAPISSFDKGSYLFRAGDDVHEIGLILEGKVSVIDEDFWGNTNIISQMGPADIFAADYACTPAATLDYSVRADTPGKAMMFDVRHVLTFCTSACAHHQRLIRNLLTVTAASSLALNRKLSHMTKRTTRDKLLSYLSSEAKRAGTVEFDIPFNRQQLADYLSVERSAMSSELSRMRADGLIDCARSHFVLKDVGV